MSWDALSPKFNDSVETCKHFQIERTSDFALVHFSQRKITFNFQLTIFFSCSQVINFRVRLAMSDDPPLRLPLAILDPAAARTSMLQLTWAYVEFRRQARSGNDAAKDVAPAVRQAAAEATLASAKVPDVCRYLARCFFLFRLLGPRPQIASHAPHLQAKSQKAKKRGSIWRPSGQPVAHCACDCVECML